MCRIDKFVFKSDPDEDRTHDLRDIIWIGCNKEKEIDYG